MEDCIQSILRDVQIKLKALEIMKQIPNPLIKQMRKNSIYLKKALIKQEFLKIYVIESQCVKSYRF